ARARTRWPSRRQRLVLQQLVVADGPEHTGRAADHEHARIDVLRHDRACADERLLADDDARAQNSAAPDPRPAPDRRPLDQRMPPLGSAHEVVVRRDDARRDEDVVLERRVRRDVRLRLNLRQRTDRRVVLDEDAPADDDVVTDVDALANAGLVADDDARSDARPGEDDRAGMDLSHAEAPGPWLASETSERGDDSTTSTAEPSERRIAPPAGRARCGGRLRRPGAARGQGPQPRKDSVRRSSARTTRAPSSATLR